MSAPSDTIGNTAASLAAEITLLQRQAREARTLLARLQQEAAGVQSHLNGSHAISYGTQLLEANEQLIVASMRAQAEAEMAESARAEVSRYQRRFVDLFDYSHDALVMVNRDGVILNVNRRAEIVFGWNQQELVGQASEVLGVSESTIRTQLKSIFAKTHAHRQSDLMKLLSSIASIQ